MFMTLSIAELIANQTEAWARTEKDNTRSIPGTIIRHIEQSEELRQPQIDAIKTRLWIQFVGNNRPISDLIIEGNLTNHALAQQYGYEDSAEHLSPTRQFFVAYATANRMPVLERKARDKKRKPGEWEDDLRRMLRNMSYPNRVYSLPMGAGKTYLMAAFIYLDLYFSEIMPNDKRFAHNFIVFAPHASKTAILPSLKTIRDFNPEWVLPSDDAKKIAPKIQIEILDSPKSASKSMRVNNPNLEKVNRLLQTHERGLVFITNAEKVVLEKYDPTTALQISFGKSAEDVKKINELRERMADIPALSVFLDEVHHTYQINDTAEKKLRQAVGILNGKDNLREVCGFSGTPYIKTNTSIEDEKISMSQLPDVVYDFALAAGIGVFLKTPKVISHYDVREETFIHMALNDFFADYDIVYPNNTKSKIAFYCPSIAVLNEEILPVVQKWYDKNRPQQSHEILSYYSNGGANSGYKKYPLHKDTSAEFQNLDSPHTNKRVVLLVAIGREGWDCRSLTAVALPRKTTTKNFVLQTSCRCLREVCDAKNEKALIYLSDGNYRQLTEQLQNAHNLSIREFESGNANSAPVVKRKPRLGKLQYKQISERYFLEIASPGQSPAEQLKKFNFNAFIKENDYTSDITTGTITKRGNMATTRQEIKNTDNPPTNDFLLAHFADFLVELQQSLWGTITPTELKQEHGEILTRIYKKLIKHDAWFALHPQGDKKMCRMAIKQIAACFAEEREYRREQILDTVEIELLEWEGDNNRINWGGGNFLPELEKDRLSIIHKFPHRVEQELEHQNIDPQDLSFNYAPYRFDSGLESNAIVQMLQESLFEQLELYYNGMRHSELNSFVIKTPYGNYTPDFLLLKRTGKPYRFKDNTKNITPIEKVLIIETKGAIYYNDNNFRAKEKFIKNEFLRHNPHIRYECFVDAKDDNDFEPHIAALRKKVQEWMLKGESQ